MGKATYNILAPDNLPLKSSGTLVVLTHDTSALPAQSNILYSDRAPAEIVEALEARGHDRAVIIGGAQAVSEFLNANLVDELILVVEPVLFGNGLPMVMDVDVEPRLSLQDVTRLSDDTVQLRYHLKGRSAAA